MRLRQALAMAREQGVARLDAQLLLAHHLQRERVWLIAHDDTPLDASVLEAFLRDLQRRAEGVPLAYLTGSREFHGLDLHVEPAVLVPRPETEGLVQWALELLGARRDDMPRASVVDLGTGSGAIALAVKREHPWAEVTATDVSEEALRVARHNAQQHHLALQFACGTWWDAVPGRRFDLALSNPPYIAAGDPHLGALQFEPALALTAGPDGLGALRAIVAGAPAHLWPGAWLLLEHGFEQAAPVQAMLQGSGFQGVETRVDLAGHPRCTGGRWPRAAADTAG